MDISVRLCRYDTHVMHFARRTRWTEALPIPRRLAISDRGIPLSESALISAVFARAVGLRPSRYGHYDLVWRSAMPLVATIKLPKAVASVGVSPNTMNPSALAATICV